jgi:hypothetical protein
VPPEFLLKMQNLPIFANEICSAVATEPEHTRTGMHTGDNKLHVFQNICRQNPAERVIYLGDSVSDLHCLLAADVGICVRDKPMSSGQRDLAETLKRVGITVKPLSDIKSGSEPLPMAKSLWWTFTLADVPKFCS